MRLASILRVEPEAAKKLRWRRGGATSDLCEGGRAATAAAPEAFGEAGVEFVSIDLAVAESAVSAFARFGRGRGRNAQLNFGDCLSYACARVHGASLLFKGEDFAATEARMA
jgi:uncharacterized protein with PIN domain